MFISLLSPTQLVLLILGNLLHNISAKPLQFRYFWQHNDIVLLLRRYSIGKNVC